MNFCVYAALFLVLTFVLRTIMCSEKADDVTPILLSLLLVIVTVKVYSKYSHPLEVKRDGV